MTLLLHLWSCHINHNVSATQTQPYLTDTLIRCGLGNLIGSSMFILFYHVSSVYLLFLVTPKFVQLQRALPKKMFTYRF
jgi:hypothetical protein